MLIPNTLPEHGRALDDADSALLSRRGAEEAFRHLRARDGHQPTPLHALPALAADLGVDAVHLKDEGDRFGLGSFKALGGAYALGRLVLEAAALRLGRALKPGDLGSPAVRAIASESTFACATDGNHGRSVAWGAREAGARAVIYVHGGVSAGRVAAIEAYGARVVRVAGTYDDSVVAAARACDDNGWVCLSDTAWPGYERIPGVVMQGYTALMHEAAQQLTAAPTHLFVQAGVGGLAAAVAGYVADAYASRPPALVVVEPARAACLLASARAGRRVAIAHGEPTVMAMLECYEPSLVAWRILARRADAFMTVDEEDAVRVMRRLAFPAGDDPPVIAGESGGVGVAGLLRAAHEPDARAALGLDASSRVLAIVTEGATDPVRYRELLHAPRR